MSPDPLLAEFRAPTYEDWVAAAERELRGRTPDDLAWHTEDGVRCPPLYTAKVAADLPHLAPGVLDAVMPSRPWRIRALVDAADPRLAARVAANVTNRGDADELLLRFDRLVQRGADPGTLAEAEIDVDLFDTDAGTGGVAAYHKDAVADILRDVDLAATPLAVDAGSGSLAVFGMLLSVAAERGLDARELHLELGVDPLREWVTGPTLTASADELTSEVDAAVRATADLPGITPLAVHSHPYHHAGASPAEELGCVILTAIEYLRHCTSLTRCPLALRFVLDTDLYLEVAKLRAARLLFAKVAAAFGLPDVTVPVHAESSARSMSTDDVHTNLLRTNIHAFAASLSGSDAITIAPFEVDHDERDLDKSRLARNQLILLRDESTLHRVHDPCRGSHAIESLTDDLARGAWAFVQEVEARGGMLAALDQGFIQDRIAASAGRRRAAFATGARTLVGTSRFVDARFQKTDRALLDTESIQHHMFAYLARRHETEVLVAADDRDSLTAAAAGGCTVGEITRALRGDLPLELEKTFYETSSDAAPFEALRDLVRGEGITAQPVLVGPAKLARTRAEFARELFAMAGMDWLEPVTSAEDAAAHAQIEVWCGADDAVDEHIKASTSQCRVVAAPPRENIAVQAFLHRGCDALTTMRELFFQVTSDLEEEA